MTQVNAGAMHTYVYVDAFVLGTAGAAREQHGHECSFVMHRRLPTEGCGCMPTLAAWGSFNAVLRSRSSCMSVVASAHCSASLQAALASCTFRYQGFIEGSGGHGSRQNCIVETAAGCGSVLVWKRHVLLMLTPSLFRATSTCPLRNSAKGLCGTYCKLS